jgi:L-lactate utilization protein LutB
MVSEEIGLNHFLKKKGFEVAAACWPAPSLPEAEPFLELCADCKKCEDYCPVRIRTGQILLKLKTFKGSDLPEQILRPLGYRKKMKESHMPAVASADFFPSETRSCPGLCGKRKRSILRKLQKSSLLIAPDVYFR